jgi:hypothetical protein
VVSPFSTPVLGAAFLVTAPAWWSALQGTTPPAEVVTRFLLCVAICWAAFEVLAALVGPAPRPEEADDQVDVADAAGPALPR